MIMLVESISDLEVDCIDLEERIPVKQYLKQILQKMVENPTSFDSIAPFGLKDWKDQIYFAMVERNLIEGSFDMDGYLEEFDQRTADNLIQELIASF